jgi:2-dehydro-3-deoxygluconokinase
MIKERRTPDAQRVSYYRAGSAGSRIASTDIDEQLIAEAGLLHVSGITPALSAQAEATLRHAIDVARTAGVPVSFDLNFRGNLWSAEGAGSVYRDVIPLADIVFAGEDEAAIAAGAGEPEDLARRIAGLGPGQAVIKLGADGALALIDGTVFRQPAFPVSVVDTVGAGDAFVAGYLAELMEGRGPAGAPPHRRGHRRLHLPGPGRLGRLPPPARTRAAGSKRAGLPLAPSQLLMEFSSICRDFEGV